MTEPSYLDIGHLEFDPSCIAEYINDALHKNKLGDVHGYFPGLVSVAFGYSATDEGSPPYEKIKNLILEIRKISGFVLRSECSFSFNTSDLGKKTIETSFYFRLLPAKPSDLGGISEFLKPEGGVIKKMEHVA